MKSHADMKMLTWRHFLFYMGLACVAGAIIGAAARLMDWSTGLIYAVTLPVCMLIVIIALREGLFGPPRRAKQQRGRPA
jgi:uncharacterized membrane protein YfcA